MSVRSFGSLTDSHREGMCEPVQNGHRGLLLSNVAGFLELAWNDAVGGTEEV